MEDKKQLAIGIINSEIKKWRFMEEMFGPASKDWIAKKIGALKLVISCLEETVIN